MKFSIIIPTYNNEKTLNECLASIFRQDYPKDEYEVMIIDGGSSDNTLAIAKNYPVKIMHNEKRSEEPARILGINKSKGDIIGFIDADNVLEGTNWLSNIDQSFEDKKVFFADTLYFTHRKKDSLKVRYQALIGGDDPLATYLGLYSRWCYFKNDWTDFPYKSEDNGNYIKIQLLDKELVPAMGSNGFFVRSKILKKFVKDSFIHSDIVYDLVNNGYNSFAKIKTGIVHNQPTFFKNKIRRMKRRLNSQVHIKYNYGISKKKIVWLFIRSLLLFPVLFDVVKGFIKKPDVAWIFHFPALYGILFLQGYYNLRALLKFK